MFKVFVFALVLVLLSGATQGQSTRRRGRPGKPAKPGKPSGGFKPALRPALAPAGRSAIMQIALLKSLQRCPRTPTSKKPAYADVSNEDGLLGNLGPDGLAANAEVLGSSIS